MQSLKQLQNIPEAYWINKKPIENNKDKQKVWIESLISDSDYQEVMGDEALYELPTASQTRKPYMTDQHGQRMISIAHLMR